MDCSCFRQSLAGFVLYHPDDRVAVDIELEPTELCYQGCGARLELAAHARAGVLWIRQLEIAPPLRRRGAGRSLAEVAELVARSLTLTQLCVFPIREARPFWLRLGYTPHPVTARVLVRPVDEAIS